jgi:hypothetical protein
MPPRKLFGHPPALLHWRLSRDKHSKSSCNTRVTLHSPPSGKPTLHSGAYNSIHRGTVIVGTGIDDPRQQKVQTRVNHAARPAQTIGDRPRAGPCPKSRSSPMARIRSVIPATRCKCSFRVILVADPALARYNTVFSAYVEELRVHVRSSLHVYPTCLYKIHTSTRPTRYATCTGSQSHGRDTAVPHHSYPWRTE